MKIIEPTEKDIRQLHDMCAGWMVAQTAARMVTQTVLRLRPDAGREGTLLSANPRHLRARRLCEGSVQKNMLVVVTETMVSVGAAITRRMALTTAGRTVVVAVAGMVGRSLRSP